MQINVPGAKPARALILKKISLFPLKTIEYVLFAALVLYKLYIFDQDLGFDFFLGDMVKVSLGSVLIVSCWTLLLPRYSRIVALWLLDCLLSLLIVSDVVYYRYFHDFITIPVLLQAKQVSALGDSIGSLLTWQDVAYVGDCLLLLLLIFCKRQFSVDKTDFLQRAAYAAIAAIVGFMLVFMPIKAYTDQYGTSLFENNWWNLSIFNITGLLGFHAYDIKRFADQNWFDKGKVTAADKLAIQQWFADHRQQLAEKTPLFGAAKGKNVMIVQLESFQNFMIGKTVNGEEITPNLNRLKSEMLYFSRHYTMIGQGHTSDAEFTVNTSLHPLPVGSVYVRYPHHLYDNLPSILKQNGYAAYAFHPYEKTFWNRQAMYRNFGFDKFYGKGDFKPAEIVGWDIGDEYFFTQSVDMLKQARQPFYAFLVALSSHHPYSNIPRSYHTLPLGPYADTLFGNYLTAVHYVDYAIGTLVDKLKKEGLWDNTVLIFYGDHDGYLNMDKKMADFIGVSFDALTQDQILRQTPLYIHIPGSRETGESRQTVGMIDIAPSVLQLLGIDASQYDMMGRTITDHADHRIVFRSGGFSDGKLYFVASPDGDVNKGVCYNLASRQRVGLPLCRDGADMAMQELSFSDKIITNDLLRDFRKQEQEQEEKIP